MQILPVMPCNLPDGLYKGRILVAANHSTGDPEKNWEDYASHAFYTDDHGKTFRLEPVSSDPGKQ